MNSLRDELFILSIELLKRFSKNSKNKEKYFIKRYFVKTISM